jgi:hypothetical protein
MRRIYQVIGIFCLSLVSLHSLALGQLVIRPAAGKSLGCVSAQEPGKWLVFGPNSIKFIQPTILDGGKSCVFEGAAGEYAVVFLPPAADAQPLVANVVLGGSAPDPPPTPPEPPPDDSLSVLGRQVRDWATQLVPQPSRVKCESVARSLDSICSQMAAGTLKDPANIIAATRTANQQAVGDLREQWLPFFEQVRKYLNEESKAGRLTTVQQHQVIWKDLAAGLRAVK